MRHVRWLRAAGAPPDLIAPVMGHADTRMVDRVYGRLSPEALRVRLAKAIGVDCIAGASDSAESAGFNGLGGRPAAHNSVN